MVTRKEVAAKAGVSPSTVSRVINNNGYVAAEARKKVEEAIADLHYVPNRAAQNLRAKSYKHIACLTHSISNPFYSEMFSGIEETALEKGYSLSLYNITSERDHYFKQVLHGPYDGVILLAPDELDNLLNIGKGFSSLPLTVYWDRPYPLSIPHVFLDIEKVTAQSVEYLIQNGHKNIAFLGYHGGHLENSRYEAYQAVMKKYGLPIPGSFHYFIGMYKDKLTTGYEAAKELLKKNPSITAIAASNDLLAIGAIRAIFESGRTVPDDISVIGIDNVELSSIVNPSLTTINLPKKEIGRLLVKKLLSQLLYENIEENYNIDEGIYLIERESVKKLI